MITIPKGSALAFVFLLGMVSCATVEEPKTDAEIKQILVQESIASYPGSSRVLIVLMTQEVGAATGARIADLAARLPSAMPRTYRMTW